MFDYPTLTIGGLQVQVLGDQHFGRKFVAGVPHHRLGEREQAMISQFQYHMGNVDCDVHVNMGDVFNKTVVSPDLVGMVTDAYINASVQNPHTEFFIIEGNHDKGKDFERTTSFELMRRILKPYQNITVVTNHILVWSMTGGPFLLFVPWQGKITTQELITQFCVYSGIEKFDAVFGHWDVITINDTSNEVPLWMIPSNPDALFITGHDHKRRELLDGKLLVVGSMQPYAHGEDWTGEMYKTITLQELELISPEDQKHMCLRVILAEGEELPDGVDAYQISIMREKKDGSLDLEVSLDGMDISKIWGETFKEFEVPSSISDILHSKFMER
jgi:DNA repair exonuclease SbcCD nuclease subunit